MSLKVIVKTNSRGSSTKAILKVPLHAIGIAEDDVDANIAAVSKALAGDIDQVMALTNAARSASEMDTDDTRSGTMNSSSSTVPHIDLQVSCIDDNITIRVPLDATVGSLKELISQQKNELPQDQRLVCGGEQLHNDCALIDIIEKKFTIHLNTNFQIFVRNLHGHCATYNVKSSETVRDLKLKIQDREGYDVEEQRLIFAGQQLCQSRTLDQVGLKQESTVQVVMRLRGC